MKHHQMSNVHFGCFLLKQDKKINYSPMENSNVDDRNKFESVLDLNFAQSSTCKTLFEALKYNYN